MASQNQPKILLAESNPKKNEYYSISISDMCEYFPMCYVTSDVTLNTFNLMFLYDTIFGV